ncbi:response regulator [Nitratireductor sp. CH_MIT9313-5]|jgi:CheY-like chemotaxis protein|uniref:response regulator n=1 Tax=Nitratireductor sp. CH_MIT9313-5 TaxID=3107764 RepID=UPI00300B6824
MARLLIVEDDVSVRTFTARALAAAGHTVETAEDGMDGLDKIKAAEGSFDLVLSDIRMPAMDGIEMAREAASTFPDLRLLLMTGFADQRERAAELDGTAKGVVNKPFTLAEIRDRVGEALAA